MTQEKVTTRNKTKNWTEATSLNRLGSIWHRAALFFEQGDLTPLAVVISVAHYGPVLEAHGEYWLVAWIVGAIIDLLHFRSVRRLFQVKGGRSIAGHIAIAVTTTLMAVGYHLRFYGGDWLLALPIPIGIAILAQHAASKPIDGREMLVKLFRNRVRAVVKIARRYQAQMIQLVIEREAAGKQAETALQELEAERKKRQAAESELEATKTRHDLELAELEAMRKAFARLGNFGQDMVMLVGGSGITQREIASKHGVSEAKISRLKTELNGAAK